MNEKNDGRVRLGYACINNSLTYPKGRNSTTCRISSVYKAGEATNMNPGTIEYSQAAYKFLINYGKSNTDHVIEVLKWHVKQNLRFYRMSSGLFPHIDNELLRNHMTEKDINEYRNLTPFLSNIEMIADIAYKNGIRVTTHPDPYAVMASPNIEKVHNTVLTLEWHAKIFQIMDDYIRTKYQVENAFKDSILCLHIGGKYDESGGKEVTLKRWAQNFRDLLPDFVQRRVCLENCEKNFNAEDLLPLCDELKIPLIFDFHHYNCYPHYHKDEVKQRPISELLPRILETWHRRNMIPKFHLSDQDPDKSNIGAHDEFVSHIPEELLQLFRANRETRFDIMIEAKAKDYAVFYLLAKYPFINDTNISDPYSLIPINYPKRPPRPSFSKPLPIIVPRSILPKPFVIVNPISI